MIESAPNTSYKMSSRLSMAHLMPSSVPMPSITSEAETSVLSNRVRLALLIGAPIVLGSGLYIYYNYYHKRGQKETKKDVKDINKTNVKRVVDSKTEAPITVSLWIIDRLMTIDVSFLRIRSKER